MPPSLSTLWSGSDEIEEDHLEHINRDIALTSRGGTIQEATIQVYLRLQNGQGKR